MFGLLVLVVPIWWRWHGQEGAVRFSSVAWLRAQEGSLRVRARHVTSVLRTLAVCLLIACLARPQRPIQEMSVRGKGIAIQMLVDRSSSMRAMDFTLEGRQVDRLTAVKNVVREFVLGGEGLSGRPEDLIGMITFAGFADSRCPLTTNHAFLLEALHRMEIVTPEEGWDEDGTAIGDAIALAVERLEDVERRAILSTKDRIKSKVVVLLTDGENTAGELSPEKAAELAAVYEIKIYAIGTGTTGVAPMPVRNASGEVILQPTRVTIDEVTLTRVAEVTGGQYRRATDADSLRDIYAEIDSLEKTEIEETQYRQYADVATETLLVGGVPGPSLLTLIVGLLILEAVLLNTVFRRVP
jgi:Ca-activated chloride channel family protein